MELVMLGETGLTVSRLGLGLAALGRPGYINIGHARDLQHDYDVAVMEARARALLDAAWAAGIRYFDAARSYGRAEEFLAHWLASRAVTPATLTIGSKWGYTYTAGWRTDAEHHEIKDHSLATLERQLAESRAWLGDYLDVYQIHSATAESGVLDNRPVLERLAELRDEGVAIGLSVTGAQQAESVRRALAIEVGGRRVFSTVQATWNLLERSAGAALHEAHRAGVGVIIKEPLANGRLTERNAEAAFAARGAVLAEVAHRLHCTLDALALAAVLAQPWVDVVLSGAATDEQLRSNLGALEVPWDETADDALRMLTEDPVSYWKTRSSLPWN
jgi:aryl-alcohol dehydrogenase-like predicted oxidoreductase